MKRLRLNAVENNAISQQTFDKIEAHIPDRARDDPEQDHHTEAPNRSILGQALRDDNVIRLCNSFVGANGCSPEKEILHRGLTGFRISRLRVSAANASTLLFLDRMVLAVNRFMILNGQRRTMF